MQKKGYKKDTIYFCNFYSFKIIFTLLTKMIAIYIRFFKVDMRRTRIEKILLKLFLYLYALYKYFYLKKSLAKRKTRKKIGIKNRNKK